MGNAHSEMMIKRELVAKQDEVEQYKALWDCPSSQLAYAQKDGICSTHDIANLKEAQGGKS